MHITAELAQSIADRAIAILHRNINIMDETATIVGSGDPSRLGSFHEGASLVIQTAKPHEIQPEEAPSMAGVRPGVNLPVFLDDRIVGVIGITGPPAEVRPFGELLREMAQLMLRQARTAEVERAAAIARESLLRQVLLGEEAITPRLEREARLLGLLPDAAYQVVLCAPEGDAADYARFDLLTRRATDAATKAGANPVMTAGPWEGRVVVVTGNAPPSLTADLYAAVSPGITVGSGLVGQGLQELRTSYRTALSALITGRRLHGVGVYSADKLVLESMLASADPTGAARCIQQTLSKLPSAGTAQGDQARETIAAYLREGMSRTRAADALSIHRHTLIYRLDQITAATGLDPRRWEDGLRLYLALLLERLFVRPVQ